MKLNDNYTLEEKRKMTGSLVHVGNFLDSSASSICTSISKGRFSKRTFCCCCAFVWGWHPSLPSLVHCTRYHGLATHWNYLFETDWAVNRFIVRSAGSDW